MVVQAVHDSAEHKGQAGPNHSSRPDEEPAEHAGDAKAHGLGGEDQEQLEAPAPELLVVDLLRKEDVERIAETRTGSGHDSNNGVLLLVERARVEVELLAEHAERLGWDVVGPAHAHGVGDELDDGRADGHAEVVVVQQDVHGGDHGAGDKADSPGADCIYGQVRVIAWGDLCRKLGPKFIIKPINTAHYWMNGQLTEARTSA